MGHGNKDITHYENLGWLALHTNFGTGYPCLCMHKLPGERTHVWCVRRNRERWKVTSCRASNSGLVACVVTTALFSAEAVCSKVFRLVDVEMGVHQWNLQFSDWLTCTTPCVTRLFTHVVILWIYGPIFKFGPQGRRLWNPSHSHWWRHPNLLLLTYPLVHGD